MKGPSVPAIFHYACFNLALKSFLRHPGDGRMQPQIPASSLSWGLLLGAILRLNSAHRLEWLARTAGIHAAANILGPRFGDSLDAAFAAGHKSEKPDRMPRPLVGGAMAVEAAAAAVGLGQASGQQLVGELILPHDLMFALAPAGSLGAFGADLPLKASLHTDKEEYKPFSGIRK